MCRGRTCRVDMTRRPGGRARRVANINEWRKRKVFWLGVVPPPVGLNKGLSWDDDRTNAIRAEPGDKRCNRGRGKRVWARTVEVQGMAMAVAHVASATSKRSHLKTKGKTELAIGLIWADAFGSKNRCPVADSVHEVDGSESRSMLMGGQVGVGQEELTSGDNRGWRGRWWCGTITQGGARRRPRWWGR